MAFLYIHSYSGIGCIYPALIIEPSQFNQLLSTLDEKIIANRGQEQKEVTIKGLILYKNSKALPS